MPIVEIDANEPIEKALRRFKKECQKAGVLAEYRKREHYEKPSVKRRRRLEAAKRKERRRKVKLNENCPVIDLHRKF